MLRVTLYLVFNARFSDSTKVAEIIQSANLEKTEKSLDLKKLDNNIEKIERALGLKKVEKKLDETDFKIEKIEKALGLKKAENKLEKTNKYLDSKKVGNKESGLYFILLILKLRISEWLQL